MPKIMRYNIELRSIRDARIVNLAQTWNDYLSRVPRALVFNPSRTFADNHDLCLPLATGVYSDRRYVRAYNGSATVTSIMFVDNQLYGCPRPS